MKVNAENVEYNIPIQCVGDATVRKSNPSFAPTSFISESKEIVVLLVYPHSQPTFTASGSEPT